MFWKSLFPNCAMSGEGDPSLPGQSTTNPLESVTCTFHLQRDQRDFPRSWGCHDGVPCRASILAGSPSILWQSLCIPFICIPSSITTISADCFRTSSALLHLAFERDSQLSSLGDAAFANCTSLQSICIPSSTNSISRFSFYACEKLASLMFERGSQMSILGAAACSNCSSLQSICLPSSIETISSSCFSDCTNLSEVIFAPNCRISLLDDRAFAHCSSLQSLAIPASVSEVTGSTIACSGIRTVIVDPANEFLRVSGDFLVDSTETRLVRYFGDESEVAICRNIEAISAGCFDHCDSVFSVRFASDCRVSLLPFRI
jgi:hypothetical protein